MATSTVSASVNSDVKRVVAARLREANITPNKVIQDLWDHIAATGDIPRYSPTQTLPESSAQFERLMQLRASIPPSNPLVSMDTRTLRDELRNRDE